MRSTRRTDRAQPYGHPAPSRARESEILMTQFVNLTWKLDLFGMRRRADCWGRSMRRPHPYDRNNHAERRIRMKTAGCAYGNADLETICLGYRRKALFSQQPRGGARRQ